LAELRVEDVAKSYASRSALSGVDLMVPEGTLTAILGASGSGKTTLLRLIAGFLELDRGRILVSGETMAEAGRTHVAPEKRAIGYVAQEGALYPHLSVGGNVGFGLPRRDRKSAKRIVDLLELVGLTKGFATRRPSELSGGEQRRVALARALACHPRLVLLDEPFSGLDPNLRAETREAVLGALDREQTTAVLVTHDQAEALSVGREVAVLRDGRLVQVADPNVLYGFPTDLDVARFVGDAIVLPGRSISGSVECALGRLQLSPGSAEGAVIVVLRPEQLEVRALETAHHTHGEDAPRRGTVIKRTFFGAQTTLEVKLDGDTTPTVAAAIFSYRAPNIGDRVEITVSGPVLAFPSSGPTDVNEHAEQ
jgi:iron(III) transport system ATP-binding protein